MSHTHHRTRLTTADGSTEVRNDLNPQNKKMHCFALNGISLHYDSFLLIKHSAKRRMCFCADRLIQMRGVVFSKYLSTGLILNSIAAVFKQLMLTAGKRDNVPFLDMSSSTSCMKLATSGGSLWMTLSLRPSFRRFSSLKKGCRDRQ